MPVLLAVPRSYFPEGGRSVRQRRGVFLELPMIYQSHDMYTRKYTPKSRKNLPRAPGGRECSRQAVICFASCPL
jgi:hypothetical protein